MPINYSLYPPNWLTEIRPTILKRANNRCEKCGVENYATVYRHIIDGRIAWLPEPNSQPVKVILTIAHLDHDEHNHGVTLDRLMAMCQLCHLRYDAEEKIRRKNLHIKK
jgi:hypothetical protein